MLHFFTLSNRGKFTLDWEANWHAPRLAVLVLIRTQPTDRTRQKNLHSQKVVDKGRGYTSRPFQIEPYGVETSESDRSEMRLLSRRSFGNLCDGITSVRFYHFWDAGGIRVGHLERSVQTLCSGDLSSHCHRQITDA